LRLYIEPSSHSWCLYFPLHFKVLHGNNTRGTRQFQHMLGCCHRRRPLMAWEIPM
jgi:hypothetical protein